MANRNILVTSFAWIIIFLYYKDAVGHDEGYKLLPSYDLCNYTTPGYYPPTIYLPHLNDTTEIFVKWSTNVLIPRDCLMLFKTCSSCQIKVQPVLQFSLPNCHSQDLSNIYLGRCAKRCAYFHLFDADYKSKTSKVVHNSYDVEDYSSESSKLHLIACNNEFISHKNMSVTLRISVKEKKQIFVLDRLSRHNIEFSSPIFPTSYALNSEEYKYEFHAPEGAYITLTFNDWLLSRYSYIKFVNGSIENKISSTQRRPFVYSTEPHMTMIFNTGHSASNTGTWPGFSAVAKYYAKLDYIPFVNTYCDQTIEYSGGTIHMNKDFDDGQLRDCIYLIRRPTGSENVQIKIVKYLFHRDSQGHMEIRDGLTSKGPRIFYASWDFLNRGQDLMTAYKSAAGFYIRLKGRITYSDSIIMTYAAYSYGCSFHDQKFICDNKRCISDFLMCDGYDHCGDNSDEASRLCGLPPPEGDSDKNTSPSDYSVSVGVIIPIVVSVVIVIVICLVFLFVRRWRRLRNETYGARDSGGHGSSRGHRHHHHGARNVQMSVTVTSGDLPPSYNEVIQTNPNGQSNMAFAWSGNDNSALTQPPSYQEAIGVMNMELSVSDLQQAGSLESISAAPREINERAIDVGGLESLGTDDTLNSFLDPASYVSSSSSSEDLSDRRRDSLTSSDSSTENYHSFVSNSHESESESTFQGSPNKEEGRNRKEQRKNVGFVDAQVQIGLSPSSVNKFKAKQNQRIDKEMNRHSDNHYYHPVRDRREIEEPDMNENNRNNVDTRRRMNNDHSSNHHGNNERPISSDLENIYRNSPFENRTVRPSESYGGEMERVQDHDRVDQGQKKDDRKHEHPRGVYYSGNDIWDGMYETEGRDRRRWHKMGPHPENSRSQSMADLSYGANGGLSTLPSHERVFPEADKRFSYAGIGDASLRSQDRDGFSSSSRLLDGKTEDHNRLLPSQGKMPQNSHSNRSPYRNDNDGIDRNEYFPHKDPKTFIQSSMHTQSDNALNEDGFRAGHSQYFHSTDQRIDQNPRHRMHADDNRPRENYSPSSLSLTDRNQQQPPSHVLMNQRENSSTFHSSEPSFPAYPAHDGRPRPTPRRSIVNSNNASHDLNRPLRGGEPLSNTIPLSVTNYVAQREDGQVDASTDNSGNVYPLAQLVFKATDDDVYV